MTDYYNPFHAFSHRLVILSLLDTNSVPMKVQYTELNLHYSKPQ